MLEHKNRDCFSMQFCQQNLSPDCGMAPNEDYVMCSIDWLFLNSQVTDFFLKSLEKNFSAFFLEEWREGDLTWVYVQSRKMF